MTLRIYLGDLAEGERRLDPAASRYLLRVHRLVVGDRFVAFDPEARLEAEGEVVAVDRGARVRLAAPRPASRIAQRPIEVIQSLPKGSKIDAIVRDATELGATRVAVVQTKRSVRQRVDLARLRRIAVEAARQCGRGDLPIVETFAELALETSASHRLCLHPAGERAFGDQGGRGSVAILIGPEGGFDETELARIEGAGFALVRLGAFTMRTETACAAALGALAALEGLAQEGGEGAG